MDFDHHAPGSKTLAIGESALVSTARLLAEIAKCEVVCANCHRIRTFTRLSPERAALRSVTPAGFAQAFFESNP
jgi:hypothetical protein